MVYQEFSLIPSLSVAENIFLGRLPRNRLGMIDWPETYRRARESLSGLGVDIDPRAEVRNLSVAEQQLTEIARILAKSPQIVLLDEPTSALSDAERETLFSIIRRLQARGVGIIYISHRLQEVPLIGTRVTVLRDGQVMGTLPVEQANTDTLINMMVGRRLTEQFPKSNVPTQEVVLQVRGLSSPECLDDLSFELRRGEILGIFGVMGAGQTELAESLFGLRPTSSGQIVVEGRTVRLHRPAAAIAHGLGFLTARPAFQPDPRPADPAEYHAGRCESGLALESLESSQ